MAEAKHLKLEIRTNILGDWSKSHQNIPPYYQTEPTNDQEVAAVLQFSRSYNRSIRVRGAGHSMSGQSLPRTMEISLSTEHLRQISCTADNYCDIGAGAGIFEIRQHLQKFGSDLVVYNDGGIGPSLGGYIAAGGIGTMLAREGGLWDHTRLIRIMDSFGKIHTIRNDDKAFAYLFGSQGKLGIILSAEVEVRPLRRPVRNERIATIREINSSADAAAKERYNTAKQFWFTFFYPPRDREGITALLKRIKEQHQGKVKFLPDFEWGVLPQRSHFPPMLGGCSGCMVTGIWGFAESENYKESLNSISEKIQAIVTNNPNISRYWQSEYVGEKFSPEQIYPKSTLREFTLLQQKFNPDGWINSD